MEKFCKKVTDFVFWDMEKAVSQAKTGKPFCDGCGDNIATAPVIPAIRRPSGITPNANAFAKGRQPGDNRQTFLRWLRR